MPPRFGMNHGKSTSLRAPRRTVIVLMRSADTFKIHDKKMSRAAHFLFSRTVRIASDTADCVL